MTRSFHPPLYMAIVASLLAFLLADVFTPGTAHSAMSINLCNHSGPEFEKIAARFKEELKPGEKIKPALKRFSGNALNRIVQNEASEGNYPWVVDQAGKKENITGEYLSSGIQNKEPDSLRILDHFCHEVSKGLVNLILLLDLDRVVIGGGVSEIGEPLRNGIEKWIEKTLIGSEHRPKIEVKLAKLGSNAGAIGAALSTTNYF